MIGLFGLLGALALTIPFYRIFLYSDRALFFRDLARDLLAQKSIWAAAVRAGEGIPYWNLYALAGTPFYTMTVGAPLHPLNILFVLFPQEEAPRALAFYLWAHYLAFYAGAFFLLRSYRCRPPLAALMAASLTLSGYMLSAHSLGHLLAASVAVPWYFFFQRKYFGSRNFAFLFLASAALAWPIYGGDPQFSYMLVIFSGFSFLSRRLWKQWATLGLLAFLSSAAQLLPFVSDILKSERLSIDKAELVFFSFHPIRLAELFFPFFFGNRYGGFDYWGGQYVNFSYRQPFIFSIYPGILTLLALFLLPASLRWKRNNKLPLALLLAMLSGFVVSMGFFLPIPLYEWLAELVPLFGLFRYPERFLFWPLFSLWLLAAIILEKTVRQPKLLGKPLFVIPSLAFLVVSAALYFGVALEEAAARSVLTSSMKFALLLVFSWAASRLRKPAYVLLGIWAAFFVFDLAKDQAKLIWDQSKHIADGERYGLVKQISADLKSRKNEISHGAAFRFGSEHFSRFLFATDTMDHTTSTTFSAFENLVPNTAGIFRIEDIAGYFSFIPRDRILFWDASVRSPYPGINDLRFYHDLMGAYYVPERDGDQQIKWKVNTSAQPYLSVPERVFLTEGFEASLKTLRNPDFRSNRDMVIAGAKKNRLEQKGERGNFVIQKRNGREMVFDYLPLQSGSQRYILLNEGFDENWRAYSNGKKLPVLRANGWAIAVSLNDLELSKPVTVSFRYENPYILIGFWMTMFWFATGVFYWIKNAVESSFSHRGSPNA